MGQRPMSQNKDSLQTVLNESNCDGILLRPLSAKMLLPTIAEEKGWVDRDRLEGITGRSRERQLILAKEIGLADFESPGGGCLLTDENFAKKMFDFIKHDKFEVKDIPVMKFGRHFRLKDGAKLIVGRDKEENGYLQDIDNDKFYHIRTVGIPGPHAMLSKNATKDDKELAAKIILTYCKTSVQNSYTLSFDGEELSASPLESRAEIKPFTIL
ncbi:MAG: ATP-binding protein, partial [Sulfurimonas sp.]|nr:ATP-binding protein [Sulfurimonas sp.]